MLAADKTTGIRMLHACWYRATGLVLVLLRLGLAFTQFCPAILSSPPFVMGMLSLCHCILEIDNSNFDLIYFGLLKNTASLMTLRTFGGRLLGIVPYSDHILYLFFCFSWWPWNELLCPAILFLLQYMDDPQTVSHTSCKCFSDMFAIAAFAPLVTLLVSHAKPHSWNN